MAWWRCSPRRPPSAPSRSEDPDGELSCRLRPVALPHPVPGRRARRPRNGQMGGAEARSVPVIDHWWQTETGSPMTQNPAGLGLLPVKYGSPGVPMPGYDIRDPRRRRPAGAARHARQCRGQAAAAARLPADAVECRPAVPRRLSRRVPRLLQDGRCRLDRRGRLSLRHGPHRRHHQCRRPPAVDRRHGGGAGRASRRRRMRRDRHRRRR